MSTIVNPAWKSAKKETIVKWKGVDYEIGSDAFGSVNDAVAAGNTDDLVIVDKKLTSPVTVLGTKEAIGSAATDIFASTATPPEKITSADGKTDLKTIKFSAAAGGTATINKDGGNPALNGFEKVTATKAGGEFFGGKQDISSSAKTVTDMDKGLETHDDTVSVSSSATGTLSVSGEKTSTVSASVAAIKDAEGNTDESIAIAKNVFDIINDAIGKTDGIKAEEYKDKTGASYASVTLKFAEIDSAINGGSYTEKATAKTSETDEKVTSDYSYSFAQKIGAGSASLTDSSAGNLIGFKSVKIASSNAALEVGGIDASNYSEDYTLKTAYDADKSSSISISKKEDETMAGGSLTVTGKSGKEITIGKEVEGFSSINLKYATVEEELDGDAGNNKATIDISVKTQNDNPALTASFSYDKTETAQATLTAANSTIKGEIDGFKSVSISNSKLDNVDAEATNITAKYTKKETGIAQDGISPDQQSDYVSKFGVKYEDDPLDPSTYDKLDGALIDTDQAWSLEYSEKVTASAGGTTFKVSGKVTDNSSVTVEGYKTVSLDNTDTAKTLTAVLSNDSSSSDYSKKKTFTPGVSFNRTKKSTFSDKAFGDATIKGLTTASVSGFASVKVTGSLGKTALIGVAGQNTVTETSTSTRTVKAGTDNPIGTYTGSGSDSSKAASTLDVTKATLSGVYTDLKKVTLKDVVINGNTDPLMATRFMNAHDYDSKDSLSVTWNAEEVGDEDAPDEFYNEKVTSWTYTNDEKSSIVGDFSVKNSAAGTYIGDNLWIDNFKKVDITLSKATDASTTVNVYSLANKGDKVSKTSEKRTVTETKRTQDFQNQKTKTATGTLTVTGKSSSLNVTTLNIASPSPVEYATITLKDAAITGANAEAYTKKESFTASETATLDAGTATVVTLKVSKTYEKAGSGSFSASGANAFNAFNGTLKGYSTITLKDKISIGAVNNTKYIGDSDTYYVPTDEYFDVIAENAHYSDSVEKNPDDPTKWIVPSVTTNPLTGNISGSYSLDAKGQINSSWTGYSATLSSGSFKQSATVAGVTAGNITGYDKVELTDVAASGIDGKNEENTTVLTYKYANDEEVANSNVTTTVWTSSSSVKLTGKKFLMSSGNIVGYKTVSLTNADVDGNITAYDYEYTVINDKLSETGIVTETVNTAVGSLTASNSSITGIVDGFQKVTLTNTSVGDWDDNGTPEDPTDDIFVASDIYGGSDYTISTTVLGVTFEEEAAVGTFYATADVKSIDPKLAVAQTVGDVTGFQKVILDDYNAGNVEIEFVSNPTTPKATYVQLIPANDEKETPITWNKAAATKSNQFTASADYYTTAGASPVVVRNEITVGAVTGYGKVDATALKEIGAVVNASITDSVEATEFPTRNYDATHYGDWTATAKETETGYTKISVSASGNAKIKGVIAKNNLGVITDYARTIVKGDIAGYKDVTLDAVTLGSGAAVKYVGGTYSYTTKTDSDDQIVATSTNTANGTLKISNAEFVAGTTFAVEGFKTVNANIDGAAQFTSIIGGNESAQFTEGALDFTTYKSVEKASVTTDEGSVTGKVAGFMTMEFTDTNFSGQILGFDIGTAKDKESGEIVQTYATKSSVAFYDTNTDPTNVDSVAQTIGGFITNAKSIVFKADADKSVGYDDFDVKATVVSNAGMTTIEFDKCQATVDLSTFFLTDDPLAPEKTSDDEIKLTSGTTEEAYITLGGDYTTDINAYFANMAGARISGIGTIASTAEIETLESALKAANISVGEGITISKITIS